VLISGLSSLNLGEITALPRLFHAATSLVQAGLWPQGARIVHAFALAPLRRSTVGKHSRISLRIHHHISSLLDVADPRVRPAADVMVAAYGGES
jgi:hypothetical protein